MEPQTDVIVAIAKHRERYFGGAGKMLIPCPATVAAQIRRIPEHQLMSKELLQVLKQIKCIYAFCLRKRGCYE